MQTEKNTVYTHAEGTLKDEDYNLMMPELKKLLKQYDEINWYFRMEKFEGWTLTALWRDLKFDIKNADRFDRIAIVGDKKWQEIMAKVMEPFTSADVKYFSTDQNEQALEWIEAAVHA